MKHLWLYHSLGNNLSYRCYGNRAVPQSQHSLDCFGSELRSAGNDFVGRCSECKHGSEELWHEVTSRAQCHHLAPWCVLLSQALSPPVPFPLSLWHLWAVKSSLFMGASSSASSQLEVSWFLNLETILPPFFPSKSCLLLLIDTEFHILLLQVPSLGMSMFTDAQDYSFTVLVLIFPAGLSEPSAHSYISAHRSSLSFLRVFPSLSIFSHWKHRVPASFNIEQDRTVLK